MKLEGYYMGIPMYSDPNVPPDILYCVNHNKFAINFPLRKDGKPDMRYSINKMEKVFKKLLDK